LRRNPKSRRVWHVVTKLNGGRGLGRGLGQILGVGLIPGPSKMGRVVAVGSRGCLTNDFKHGMPSYRTPWAPFWGPIIAPCSMRIAPAMTQKCPNASKVIEITKNHDIHEKPLKKSCNSMQHQQHASEIMIRI